MPDVDRRRLITWGTIGLMLVALLAWALAPRPVPVDVHELSRGALAVTVEHEGKTRVRDRYLISAPVAGRVQRIELEPGDPVKAGETVLATFEPADPSLLDARSRAEARAAVGAAAAAETRARAQRDQARAEQQLARTELERIRLLAGGGIVSRQELDTAETAAEARQEALAAAESALRTARYEVAAARARLLEPDGATPEGSPLLHLRSPVDGVVLRRIRESAATVPQGESLLEVADPDRLEVVADFLSTDAVKIRPGMRAEIDRWGGDEALAARVRRVEPSGFLKVSALGVEEQRVNVILDFDDPREAWEALGDEYRVEVAVAVWESADVLRVPVSALFRHQERWAVFQLVDGEARLAPVEIGRRGDLEAEVVTGLKAGDRVVVHPPDELADGVGVEVRKG